MKYFSYMFVAALLALGLTSCGDDDVNLTGKLVSDVNSPISYPMNASACDVIDYLDRLDVTSDYIITHAIIEARGQEDSLNVGLEACGLEVPK